MMTTSDPRRRLAALSQHLTPPPPPTNVSSSALPPIPTIAGDSASARTPGKVIIITGANSPLGIGRASAHQFARNGARAIYLCDYDSSHLNAHVSELQSLYPKTEAHARQFDAADEKAVAAVVDEALEAYGRLDVMFANAGIVGSMRQFKEVRGEDFMRTMRVNVLSVFVAIKEGARGMRVVGPGKERAGGSIVATSSVAGLRSGAGATDYSASKAAVRSLVQTTAWQLAGTGIRVNAVMPGLIETGMTQRMYEMARERGTEGKIGQLNPTNRGAVADEVARVVLFLGSDEASYVNGQGWAVDGGLSAGHNVVPGKLG